MLSEFARLGARLIIQWAIEEFDTWFGRARYERRPERQRGLRNYNSGMRNGFRPRHVQTAHGELRIEVPQAREAVMPFVLKLFTKWHCKRGRIVGLDDLSIVDELEIDGHPRILAVLRAAG